MASAIRAELRKIFTTRLWWGMAIGMVVVGGGLAAVLAALAGSNAGGPNALPSLDQPGMVNTVFTAGLSFGYLLTLAVGVMTIGSEYRHKTITSTFLSTPRRVRVMLAKVVALLVVGVFYGLVFTVSSVAVGATIITLRGFNAFPSSENVPRTLALSLLALGLWALIGLGTGILISNQVAALLISIGIAWIGQFLFILISTRWDGPARPSSCPARRRAPWSGRSPATGGTGPPSSTSPGGPRRSSWLGTPRYWPASAPR